jgi:hypothetical protein
MIINKKLDKAIDLSIGDYLFKMGLIDQEWLLEYKKIVELECNEDE